MSKKVGISVFWFRRDLRFLDNTALIQALDGKRPVLPIFIFDTEILQRIQNKHDARVNFIYCEIIKIKICLEQKGSSLLIFYNKPIEVFKTLFSEYDIKEVFANRDYEPYSLSRDSEVSELLKSRNIRMNLFKDHLIFEGKEIIKNDGSPYQIFTPFKKRWISKYYDLPIKPNIETLPFDKFLRNDPVPAPTLQFMGFESNEIKIPSSDVPINLIRDYDKNRDYPARKGTSKLGIHLRFGTVSIREIVEKAAKNNNIWLNELIWREFYSAILQHFPYVATGAFKKKYNLITWRNDFEEFAKWCNGQTGYPLVDAGMRELNATGYMHNRVRMVTASFLTKHLLIDWRWGESYFADKLLDYELASNNGGWQWAAGTGTDAQPYFRVFNPESQAIKFDPNGEYIKKWVSEFGTDAYPEPMVDHKYARNRAIETYKSVL